MLRVTVLSCALCASCVLAGDLNPPPGPVSPTMHALDELEPSIPISQDATPGDADSVFRITTRGRYHLTRDVLVFGAGNNGIEIAGAGIEIDMNGYTMVVASTAGSGITFDGAFVEDVTVRDGRISGGSGSAIDLLNVENVLIDNVTIDGFGGSGILLGSNSTVRGCELDDLGGSGIVISGTASVSDCSVSNVGAAGIDISTGRIARCVVAATGAGRGCFELACCGSIVDCQATGSQGDGFVVDSDSTVSGCVATATSRGYVSAFGGVVFRDCNANFCSGRGFEAGADCVFEGCVAKGSAGEGFVSTGAGIFRGCVASGGGDTGFEVWPGSTLSDCAASGNARIGIQVVSTVTTRPTSVSNCVSMQNGISGFSANTNATFTSCSSAQNQGDGFSVTARCNIVDCNASSNDGDGIDGFRSISVQRTVVSENGSAGIRLDFSCVVRDCDVSLNSGIGIVADDDCEVIGSRIDGGAGIGIQMRHRCTVRDTTVSGHETNVGILVTGDTCVVSGNTLSENLTGIQVADASNCLIDGNRINRSVSVGIFLESTSQTCDVVRNLINSSLNWIVNQGAANDIAPLNSNPATAGPWDNLQL